MRKLACIILLLMSLGVANAGYWEEHLYTGKVVQDIVKQTVKTGNPWIDKPIEWGAMSVTHIVVDRFIGEHHQGEYHADSTLVGVLTMYFATPEEDRWAFVENFICTAVIPDVLFKSLFHAHGLKPIVQLNQDQSVLISKAAVMFYTVRIEF